MNTDQTYDGRYICGKCGRFYFDKNKADACCIRIIIQANSSFPVQGGEMNKPLTEQDFRQLSNQKICLKRDIVSALEGMTDELAEEHLLGIRVHKIIDKWFYLKEWK